MAPKRKSEGDAKGGKKAKSEPPAALERPPGGKLFFLLKRRADVLTAAQIEEANDHTVAVTGLCSMPGNKPAVEAMQEGDEVLFFQSPAKGKKEAGFEPGITALLSVARGPYPDPEDDKGRGWLAVDLHMEEVFENPVPLSALKAKKDGELAGLSLFDKGSILLSLHALSKQHFDYILDDL